MSSNALNLESIFSQVVQAELPLVKEPLLAFSAALEAPGANFLTVQNAAVNVLLTFPQLSEPSQSVLLKIVGAALAAFVDSIGKSSGSGTSSEAGSSSVAGSASGDSAK